MPAGSGAPGSGWEGMAGDQEGGAAFPCAALPAWREAAGGRPPMSASQTSRQRAAKAAGESAGWKVVKYPRDSRTDWVVCAAWDAQIHSYPWLG